VEATIQPKPALNISNAMIRSIMMAMDVVFKASGTDVRLHGRENVPIGRFCAGLTILGAWKPSSFFSKRLH
jgi:hypothetical protein